MGNVRPQRTASSPDLSEAGDSDLPLDHALSLLLADETENALRWGAAVLESGPWTPSALIVTARLLDQMGRRRAAIDGLRLAVKQATAAGNLPLAMAAIGDLQAFGAEVDKPLDQVASAFCRGSDRLYDAQAEPLLPQLGEFRPLSPFLTGPALASKAAQILEAVRRTESEDRQAPPSHITPLPLFSSLPKATLHDLLAAFETVTVPAGHAVIREGEEEAATYIVARGELEVSRQSADDNGKPLVLARLGSGAFFGEMALLSPLPSAASVVATRPSILLVAKRNALETVVEKHPDVAVELAAHCRRQAVANLGWASPVVVAIPPQERAKLVERFETRMFEAGDKLVERGDEARGLHLIVSGAISVVADEGGERITLATLTPGETVGEVELVLCRNAAADAIAVRPTATLFLPREEFFGLAQDHPTILQGLYAVAVRRHTETKLALGAGSESLSEEMKFVLGPGAESVTDKTPLAQSAFAEMHQDPQDETVTLVENVPSRANVDPLGRTRIKPLARGTLQSETASSRVSPVSTSSAHSTLPSAKTPSTRASVGRLTLPPPVPPNYQHVTPIPASAKGARSVPPTSISAMPPAVPARAQGFGRVALAAIAAGAVAFATAREFRGNAPVSAPASAAVGAAANPVPVIAPTASFTPWKPVPAAAPAVPSEAETAEATPVAKLKVATAAPTRIKVKVEPRPTPTPAVTASVAPAAAAPPVMAAALSQRPAPVSTAPTVQAAATVGEFGGRE